MKVAKILSGIYLLIVLLFLLVNGFYKTKILFGAFGGVMITVAIVILLQQPWQKE